ncbi:MAG: hybrid sensor histidine kinase/response regulator [Candidatus Kapabacteria bacterium]|nr:hybrid sensor histidine kinase/response regulator [Candidatus Kapabacteria bacterium]
MKEYQLEESENKYNLLVIDDEEEITKTLFRQFRRKYNVFIANSANSALSIMEEENIQVVLSDQRMPDMTGVNFFSKIKDKYPDALKLLLTGYSDIEAVIGAINEGQVFRYLTKPWNPAELNLAIEEAFDKYELITKNRLLIRKLKEAKQSLENKVKERTQELESANANLLQLNIEKNKYIGMAAHDLRSPIGSAFSFSNLLIEDYTVFSQNEHVDFLKIINERCLFALNLIENFLDASKIESGILDLDVKENDYCELVQSCISQNSIYAQKKSQQIIFNSEQPKIKFSVDRNKIEQVLDNLISNAIKYSHKNKKIWVSVRIENNNLITEVKDEGPGIPENELDSVFVAYKTTTIKSTNNEKSTGLGLAIAKKIIEAHKGEIFVKSKEGIGSTFYFTLPFSIDKKEKIETDSDSQHEKKLN